jgi:hypothetical protein
MSESNVIVIEERQEKYSKKRAFSIELNSRNSLSRASVDNTRKGRENKNDDITIEGTIGFFKEAQFVEGEVLEVCGSEGVLRIDLTNEEIRMRSTSCESKPEQQHHDLTSEGPKDRSRK